MIPDVIRFLNPTPSPLDHSEMARFERGGWYFIWILSLH
jgi:hypothetical protein